MVRVSAGILLYKIIEGKLKVFLVHPGGPFFKGKEDGWWSIPKGEVEGGEEGLVCGIREVLEETGIDLSRRGRDEFVSLGEIQQKGGKNVYAWALKGDWSGLLVCKSWVKMQQRDGSWLSFPEVDKAGFFGLEEAKKKMNRAQWEFVEKLKEKIKV